MKSVGPLLLSALLALPGIASADVVSVAAGGGIWRDTPSGDVRKLPDTSVDVEKDLFWKSENQNYLFVTLEHPVPVLPNVRLSSTKLEHSGSGNLTRSITVNGQTYNLNEYIENTFKFNQTDITAYWELLDNVVSVDLGLNVKSLDISYTVTGRTTGSTSDSIKLTLPMLYAMVGASPLPGLMLSVEGTYVSLKGSAISDVTAKVSYTSDYFVGVEAGYRTQTYKLDDTDNYSGNLEFKGPFAGVYLKF